MAIDYDLAPFIQESYSAPPAKRFSILDKMHFRALDSDFNATSLVDAYDSIIWTERYNEVGDFEIHGPLTTQLYDLASNSSYIFNSATFKLMVIEKTIFEYDDEAGNTITISGRSFESFLDRRIMLKPLTVLNPVGNNARISHILCDLVSTAFGNAIAARYWNKLQVVNATGTDSVKLVAEVPLQFEMGKNLIEIVLDFCKAFSLGFKCELSVTTGLVTFTIYEGSDHSIQGEEMVVFSDLYDNLISSKEDLAFGHIKTFGLVTGNFVNETTNVPLRPQDANLTNATGLARKETHIKTDQEKTVYNANNTTSVMSDANYDAALLEAGMETLNSTDNKVFRNYDGEILEIAHRYNEDFTLGDIVSLWLPHGQRIRARLEGITFSDDANEGKTLAPSFNYDV